MLGMGYYVLVAISCDWKRSSLIRFSFSFCGEHFDLTVYQNALHYIIICADYADLWAGWVISAIPTH